MRNIYLTGMMGSGKSVLARMVADQTGLTCVDMDAAIVADAQMTIPEIFEQKGEEYFRELESNVLYDLHKMKNLIVATGGGTILSDRNYELMEHSGIIIYVKRSVEDIISTINVDARPLLKADPENIRKIFEERKARYRDTADYTIANNGSLQEATDRIKACIALG